ncbi:CatB-related O-acetyltransferase [Agrobacterium sp. OT33]|uniref:CatB-related O-acetyltransferase n=1 Tax=Agrobacterium sp. OT33 TaxID=2815338 RepID=UPI001A8CDD21|nr:CatB-related O-acetyltransferase [Agrobacterium sp. OT33]MBO0125233.1 hypothetical protein [Agrobacterium sp. OT33]
MVSLHEREIPMHMARGRLDIERPAALNLATFRGNRNSIGAFSYANVETIIYNTNIGRFCSIAHKVMIAPNDHPVDWLSTHTFVFNDRGTLGWSSDYMDIMSNERFEFNDQMTNIGNDVWIGYGAFIRRGVTIGDGAIIAAHSTVVKDVEPYSIVGGTPAKVIKMRFSDEIIERLKALKWWDYKLEKKIIGSLKYSNVEESIEKIEEAINAGRLNKLNPERVTLIDGEPQDPPSKG